MSDTLYEFNSSEDGNNAGIGNTTTYYSMNFTTGTAGDNVAHTITSLKLQFYKTGAGTGDLQVAIKAVDGSHYPTGSDLSTGTVAEADIPASSTVYEISMSPYVLQPSTEYGIVLRLPDRTASFVYFRYDNNSIAYSGGRAYVSYNSGSSWGAYGANSDFIFYVYGIEYVATGTGQYINIGDNFQQISEMFINIGDAWKAISQIFINIGDNWATCYET